MNFLTNPTPSTTLEDAKPEQVGFACERLDRIRAAMDREITAGRIPGAVVGIMRRGRLAYLESFGVRDPASNDPMPINALFSIASMTKAMTSVAALQLFEEGRLSLADPVATYLPELANLTGSAASYLRLQLSRTRADTRTSGASGFLDQCLDQAVKTGIPGGAGQDTFVV
jgi:CubicO group peptidase (beta-lactamase class C family)